MGTRSGDFFFFFLLLYGSVLQGSSSELRLNWLPKIRYGKQDILGWLVQLCIVRADEIVRNR